MIKTHVRMAKASIRGNRLRSFLTVVGIVIGVASVVTIVSIGEGVKRDVEGEIRRLGNNLLTIRPGAPELDENGNLSSYNLSANTGASSLTLTDVEAISKLDNITSAAPIALLSGTPNLDDGSRYGRAYLVATTPDMPSIFEREVKHGSFFLPDDTNRNLAVIGKNVAEKLFRDDVPVGQSFNVHNDVFVVKGVMEGFSSSAPGLATSYNDAIFIPVNTALRISNNLLNIRSIEVKIEDNSKIDQASQAIKEALIKNHSNQEDFTIFKQDDLLNISSRVFDLLTYLVAAIAGISLLVGGIGVMNIMLVSVTERTREIGIRKALGATNQQILGQFLVEAVVLSVFGGIVGVLAALLANIAIAATTPLSPALAFQTVLLALGVSVSVGLIFGITPAMKASRKDPIASLRYE